ncbi:MAG: GNAT family N-acetyltransferase [Clostridiaceae bacterium]|nr:GNAT family N-acetyltransferase [Eubacteriales bacterium]
MKDLGTVTLETERLLLRRIAIEDTDAMYENWASDPLVAKGAGWPVHQKREETARIVSGWVKEYEAPHCYHWVVIEKQSGKPFGTISGKCASERNETCEVGYCYGRTWWGKGYATEALKEVLRFLLGDVGLFLIEAKHRRGNPASGRVMEKADMRFEAALKNRVYDAETGVRDDYLIYSIERKNE